MPQNFTKCEDIKGSNSIIRIKEEAEYGAFEQTGYTKIPFNSFDIAYQRNEIESETIVSGRSPSEKALGDVEISGDIVIPVDDNYSHFFLKGIMGNHSVSDVSGKKEHKYTISDSCLPSFAAEKSFTGTSLNYLSRGIKFNTLSVELGGEGQVNATVSALGKIEQMRRIPVDANTSAIATAAISGATKIKVAGPEKFAVGDVIVFEVEKAQVSVTASRGDTIVITGASEASTFTKGELIQIDGIPYMVLNGSGNKLILDTPLEKSATIGTSIVSVDAGQKITAINGSELTLNKALTNNLMVGDVVYGEPTDVPLTISKFEHAQATLTSADSSVDLALVQTLNLTIENNSEGQRFINTKGSFGKILEGKVNITCSLGLIFGVENAKMLEEAKIGKTFDLKILLSNKDGNQLEIYFPVGKLTPVGPAISGPSAISVEANYSPSGSGIYIKLVNDKVYA